MVAKEKIRLREDETNFRVSNAKRGVEYKLKANFSLAGDVYLFAENRNPRK